MNPKNTLPLLAILALSEHCFPVYRPSREQHSYKRIRSRSNGKRGKAKKRRGR